MRTALLAALLACLWDSDTIDMERRQFPGIHELLAGKFTKHSDAYYGWRIEDRTAKLRDAPGDAALTDDLAVAYEKLGRHDEAIALMRASLERHPDRYECLANLGTFLVHAGRLEEGLSFLRRAIEVNPDAHFGREVIQVKVIEYVLACRAAGRAGLPLWTERDQESFAGFLAAEKWPTAEETAAGIKGVSGMMFFGNAEHPVLLECLGHLLADPRRIGDAERHLATRAYLKASYAVEGEERQAYRALAADALGSQLKYQVGYVSLTLDEVEAEFRRELEEGRRFQEAIAADEQAWAEAGLDLDAEFRRKYHGEGRVEPLSRFPLGRAVLVAAGLGLLATLFVALLRRRARRAAPASRRWGRSGPLVVLVTLVAGHATAFGVGWLFVHPLATYGILLLYVVAGFVLMALLRWGAERWLAEAGGRG